MFAIFRLMLFEKESSQQGSLNKKKEKRKE